MRWMLPPLRAILPLPGLSTFGLARGWGGLLGRAVRTIAAQCARVTLSKPWPAFGLRSVGRGRGCILLARRLFRSTHGSNFTGSNISRPAVAPSRAHVQRGRRIAAERHGSRVPKIRRATQTCRETWEEALALVRVRAT
jgi:hypothetical protein